MLPRKSSFFNEVFFFFFLFYFLAVLGLHCCAQAFSSCGERGLLLVVVRASHCGGFSCCGARALGAQASVVVAHRLSCSAACGIFPDQGLNPCPLHWQADFQPLCHQESPKIFLFISRITLS